MTLRCVPHLLAWLLTLLGMTLASRGQVHAEERRWRPIEVPGRAALSEGREVWYRCFVRVPASWTQPQSLLAESVTLTLEGLVDAGEVIVNGESIGRCGEFPPQLRSARDEVNRVKIPAGLLRAGDYNTFVLRIYADEMRPGMQGRAPVLAGYHEECVLAGEWEFVARQPSAAELEVRQVAPSRAAFATFAPATSALRRPARLTPGRHLPPGEALSRIRPGTGLAVDLVLCEPEIAQPLSIDFDERGRMWVVEYRQYPYPAGLQMTSRDKYYRASYDRVPLPPPRHDRGADRVSIHTDPDGNGTFDHHQVFVDGLNIVSSIELDNDGVWVLNPPYLLFYPDHDHDDRPDRAPVVHLEGFGLEDVHSVANSLTWGPDGWLYGAQGSTTSSRVKVLGSDAPAVYRDGAMIWRYHPQRHQYEIYAEGGGNAFGLEIDAQGRVFSGHNGGNTRGFHYVLGGYYQKGTDDKYGPLSNPYTFGQFAAMKHGDVPRFSHDWVRYEGQGLPAIYGQKMLAIDPLHQQVVVARMQVTGSTFSTADEGLALATDDIAFRPVDITVGPEGAIYVADFCEEFIAHGQHYQGQIDPDTGRIYRLRSSQGADHRAPGAFTLGGRSTEELLDRLGSPDRWQRRTALRILSARPDPQHADVLFQELSSTTGQRTLELLWLLYQWEELTDVRASQCLRHADPHVRRWTVRMIGEAKPPRESLMAELAVLATHEASVEVRAELACTARRLPAAQNLQVLAELMRHDEDADDAFLPLLIWWSLELAADDWNLLRPLWQQADVWQRPIVQQVVLERLMRRYASTGRGQLLHCAELLELAPDAAARARLMTGFEQAFVGRTVGELPGRLVDALRLAGGGSVALRARLNDPAAVATVLADLQSPGQPLPVRVEFARLCGETRPEGAESALLNVLQSAAEPELQLTALAALQAFDSPEIGVRVDELASTWTPPIQAAAWGLLASRQTWTGPLLRRLETGQVAATALTADAVERLHAQRDPAIQAAVRRHWPHLLDTVDPAIDQDLARVTRALEQGDSSPYRGRVLYQEVCGKCHQLFREGGQIGPNLTPYPRDATGRLLLQVVNPSAEIREGFETWTATTADGRVANGFLVDQDTQVIVLRGADGQNVTLRRDEVETLDRNPRSLMPVGLLRTLSDQQVRDLFAFLRISQPLNEP